MLVEILSNFSEDELLDFLPKSSINFALDLETDNDQEKEDTSFNKAKLAGIVASVKRVEFLFEKSLRDKLIERLSPQQLAELFPSFKLRPNQVTPQHYDAVISWSEENPNLFASTLGLSTLYNLSLIHI